MRIFKSHPLLKLVNSYLIDVRPVGTNILETLSLHHCGNMMVTSKLVEWETQSMNTASWTVRVPKRETVIVVRNSVTSLTLRAILLELKRLWTSKIGLLPDGNRESYANPPEWIYISRNSVARTNCAKSISQAVKSTAKRESPLHLPGLGKNVWNTRGLPTEGNLQGSRRLHSTCSKQGRELESVTEQTGHRVGLTHIKAVTKLSGLYKKAEKFKDTLIVEDIYKRFILDKNLYLVAYDKLKSKPGNMTPAISPITLDGMSDEVLDKIIESLRSEKFQFSPSRRVNIPKKSGGTRPLSVGNPRDKLVQEVMRMALEAMYEPRFLDTSHGFRPNRGTHTALKHIFTRVHGVWAIEGDFSKCFDTIDHQLLINYIGRNVKDDRFISLLWKALKMGYLDSHSVKSNIIGTPQGSIISPILANIYLHQLDEYIEKLKAEYDIGTRQKIRKEWRALEYKLTKARKEGDSKEIKKLLVKRKKIPSISYSDSSYKRLYYVRYADDWIVTITGPRKDAVDILNKIDGFGKTLKLNLNLTKTRITNLHTDSAFFLGTTIKFTRHVGFSHTQQSSLKQRKIGPRIMLTAPIQNIRKRLTEAGFIKNNNPHPKWLWMPFGLSQIVHQYNAVYRGFVNYYSFVQNMGALARTMYFYLKSSCLRLIAAKMKLKTKAGVYKKYGKHLIVTQRYQVSKGKATMKTTRFVIPKYKVNVWDFKINPTPVIESLYASPKSIANLMNLECSLCGSDYKVEMHHVRKMSDLKPTSGEIDRLMIKYRRKQIPLCRECHMKKHSKNTI